MRNFGAKLLLLVISVLVGIGVGFLVSNQTQSPLYGILAGVGVSLAYPVMGVLIIELCEKMKRWAYGGEVQKWDIETRLLLATVSPLVLLICGILYLYMGIINRLY